MYLKNNTFRLKGTENPPFFFFFGGGGDTQAHMRSFGSCQKSDPSVHKYYSYAKSVAMQQCTNYHWGNQQVWYDLSDALVRC